MDNTHTHIFFFQFTALFTMLH